MRRASAELAERRRASFGSRGKLLIKELNLSFFNLLILLKCSGLEK